MSTNNQQYIKKRNLQIGSKIRYFRNKEGMTLISLSEKTGISKTQLQKYELGKHSISTPILEIISSCLEVNIYLFAGSHTDKAIATLPDEKAKIKLATISMYMDKLAKNLKEI